MLRYEHEPQTHLLKFDRFIIFVPGRVSSSSEVTGHVG